MVNLLAEINFGIRIQIGSVPVGFHCDTGALEAIYSHRKTNPGTATVKSASPSKQHDQEVVFPSVLSPAAVWVILFPPFPPFIPLSPPQWMDSPISSLSSALPIPPGT